MSEVLLEQLQSIDRDILTGIVRKDQGSKSFELLNWTVEPIQHVRFDPKGELFRFSGLGRDEVEEKSWNLVMKVANRGEKEQGSVTFWKREVLICQDCFFEHIAGPLSIPRCYGVVEHADQTWIWMEYIVETAPKRWELDHFAFAASSLSHFNAAYLKGEPLPEFSWLCNQYFHTMIADNGFWHTLMDVSKPGNAWESTFVKAHFSERLKQRINRLWMEKGGLLDSLDKLPQVFCHNDFHRRNLMIRPTSAGLQEVVTLDWHFSGNGPLGGDLGWLIGGSLFLFEREPFEAIDLFKRCLEAYQAGLVEEGLEKYLEVARLGCLMSIAIIPGMILPAYTYGFTEMDYYRDIAADLFGRDRDDLAVGWAEVTEFCMGCADEAQKIVAKLDW